MLRKKRKIPKILFTADWHLREDTPICYIGDFQAEQWGDVDYIANLQSEYNCTIIHAGDLFHHWKPSPWLLRETIKHLPNQFCTVYGQHDLPQHNLQLVDKCGINVLEQAGKLKVLKGVHYGQEPQPESYNISYFKDTLKRILVWHHLTYLTKPFPGATTGMAMGILRKYPQYNIIVTGDNHQSFHLEYKGRYLFNPGSLTRQDADQADYHPCIYAWYEDNSISRIPLPHKPNVISREHINIKEQRDARIDAFVSRLNNDWQASMSFEENLEEFKNTNNIDNDVIQIIYKSIEQ